MSSRILLLAPGDGAEGEAVRRALGEALGARCVRAPSLDDAVLALASGAVGCVLVDGRASPSLAGEWVTRLGSDDAAAGVPLLLLVAADLAPAARLSALLGGATDVLAWAPGDALLEAKVSALLRLRGASTPRSATAPTQAERALRLAEQRYRSFIALSAEGIWRVEVREPCDTRLPPAEQIEQIYRHGYLAECNDAMARMYGFSRAEELVGVPLGQLLVRDEPQNLAYLTAFIESGYRLENAESQEVDRTGAKKVFSNSLVGVTEGGRLLRAWGTQRDITAEVEARLRIEALADRLREALHARDTFLSVASHELRTPLTPLSLKVQQLQQALVAAKDQPLAQAQLPQVQALRRQVQRLTALVDELLDVSTISGGRLRLELEDVDLCALVHEVAQRFEPEAERAGSALTVRVGPPLQGRWDRLRLEQVLANLLSNAIKYGNAGPIQVTVEAAGSLARMTVQDQGIGIDPDALVRIFGKFERAVSERHYGGLGLGLFVTRQIVEAMGGTVQATSAPGTGTRFVVDLPTGSGSPG